MICDGLNGIICICYVLFSCLLVTCKSQSLNISKKSFMSIMPFPCTSMILLTSSRFDNCSDDDDDDDDDYDDG